MPASSLESTLSPATRTRSADALPGPYRVAVLDVSCLVRRQLDGFSIVEPCADGVVLADAFDRSEISGANALLPVAGGERDAIAYGKLARLFPIDFALRGLDAELFWTVRLFRFESPETTVTLPSFGRPYSSGLPVR